MHRVLPRLRAFGGGARPIFNLPLRDAGAGAVNTTPDYAAGSGTATFTRATAAWTKLSSGLWASVSSGVARSYYLGRDTTVGAYGGYLPEPASTNNGLWSRDLTNAAWVSGGGGVATAKTATGIDGVANSCTTLTASGANGTLLQSITLASQANVFQPFVKRRTGTGTISITVDGGTSYTDITALINSTTYTQVSVTKTAANPSIGFKITTSGDAIDVDMADCIGDSVARTPVPTTTVAVTRNADKLTFVTSGNIVGTVGSCLATVYTPSPATGPGVISTYNGGAQGQPMGITTNLTLYDVTSVRSFTGANVSANTTTKVATSWGGSASAGYAAGVAGTAAGFDGNLNLAVNFCIGGQIAAGAELGGPIKDVAIYGAVVPNLQAMTA